MQKSRKIRAFALHAWHSTLRETERPLLARQKEQLVERQEALR